MADSDSPLLKLISSRIHIFLRVIARRSSGLLLMRIIIAVAISPDRYNPIDVTGRAVAVVAFALSRGLWPCLAESLQVLDLWPYLAQRYERVSKKSHDFLNW